MLPDGSFTILRLDRLRTVPRNAGRFLWHCGILEGVTGTEPVLNEVRWEHAKRRGISPSPSARVTFS
jgi:hypothetical protein